MIKKNLVHLFTVVLFCSINLFSQDDTISQKNNEIIIEEENDLLILEEGEDDLLITDDSEEDILSNEKKLKKSEEKQSITDILATDSTTVQSHSNDSTQTITEFEKLDTSQETIQPASNPTLEQEKATLTVEEMKSINFSKNLKEYRSPKKAMFLSLLVPGLGQGYSKNFWKAALFGVLEIGCIGLSAKFNYEGKRELKKARRYADQNFQPDKFISFYRNFASYVSAIAFKDSTDTLDLSITIGDSLVIFKEYTKENLADYESDIRKKFDQAIKENEFVQGWIDCEPGFNATEGYILDNPNYLFTYKHLYKSPTGKGDTTWLINRYAKGDTVTVIDEGSYGYSRHQEVYEEKIRTSTGFYDASKYMIFAIITNHLVSAVDAFITARAYNDRLLNKISLWQKINLDHGLSLTDSGFQSHFGVRVQF